MYCNIFVLFIATNKQQWDFKPDLDVYELLFLKNHEKHAKRIAVKMDRYEKVFFLANLVLPIPEQ